MAEEAEQSLVLRMAMRGRSDHSGEVTPTRALRLALTRAALRAAGLEITTLGVGDERLSLPETLSRLDGDWLCLRLDGGEAPGLAAVDFGLLSALIETQTRGGLAAAPPEPRPLTGADVALCAPLVAGFLSELSLVEGGGDLGALCNGRFAGDRIVDLRAAAQNLPEGEMRVLSLSVFLGGEDRQGQALFALPQVVARMQRQDPALRAQRWAADLAATVLAAENPVEAILHRLRLPIEELRSWEVGQHLPLPGVRLGAVRLEGRGGRLIGRGRLGQTAGLRAMRIEPTPAMELDETALPRAAPGLAPPSAAQAGGG